MTISSLFARGRILRVALSAVFPWLPPVLFEKIDFFFHLNHQAYWYGQLTGNRLPVDLASFALWGVLAAYLLRPRWAMIQIALNAILVWVLFYVECPIYSPGGIWQPECYNTGPDGLVGVRLAGILFCFGALPVIVRMSSKGGELLNRRLRPVMAVLGGTILTVVMVWYPLAAWFSGATYLAPFYISQALLLIGLPQIATGVLAARIGRSLKLGTFSGIASFLLLSATYWTSSCPNCDRNPMYYLVLSWALFALLGSVTELGIPWSVRLPRISRWFSSASREDVRRVGLALVITCCLSTLIVNDFWDPNVLYATSISPGPGQQILGQPYYPYVGAYYNSTQYRICCVEVGVSISMANPRLLYPNNFLMVGMGIQSPNCCVDGWDFGWRADVFLLPNSSLIVSGSSWETCDGNANCGGYIWEYLWYHTQKTLNPQNTSTPIYLRMSWIPVTIDGQPRGEVNWYYNTTGTPWTQFGSFLPDRRLGTYFDIGLSGGPVTTVPQGTTLLSQFGVASKTPVSGWSVRLQDASFQLPNGTWHIIEHAGAIQGNFSFWKLRYRWGGLPYDGVTAKANLIDPAIPPDVVEFSFTGGTLKNFEPLW
jgi:hypothetical protein